MRSNGRVAVASTAAARRSMATAAVAAFVAVSAVIAFVAMTSGVPAGLAIVCATAVGIWVGAPMGLAIARRLAPARTTRPAPWPAPQRPRA